MPIALFSGLPGAGKTAQLVAEILRLVDAEPGRPIFAFGINGLKEGLAIPLTEDMLHKWWELPPGSIVCIDECQEDGSNVEQPIPLMPKDRGLPSPWVQKMTKHRHFGIDFLLTTQDPVNMSAYVRRLVDKHVHTVRKFNTHVIQRYTWGRCIDDPYNRREQKNAVADVGTLPSKVFELYKSSQLHTMKRRVPLKVWLFVASVLAAIVCAVAVPVYLHRMARANVAAVGGASQLKASSSSHVSAEDESLRHTDMVKWMRPRVAGVPWSAPMFDKLEVQAQPRLFCVAVDDGRCTCNTEQGTRYEVPLRQCREIVSNGLYNPFLASSTGDQERSSQDKDTDQAGRRQAALPPAGPPVSAAVSYDASSPFTSRATAYDYVPPTMGKWDSTPLPSGTGM